MSSTEQNQAHDTSRDHDWLDRPIYLTGLMKSGTTLLLSLLDGHSQLVVYPDEPSFYRIWLRRYQNPRHMVLDWLYGTPNPLNLNRAARARTEYPEDHDPKSKQPLPLSYLDSLDIEWLSDNKNWSLRGLPDTVSADQFDHHQYLRAIERLACSQTELKRVFFLKQIIEALRCAAKVASEKPARWAFKQPMPNTDDFILNSFIESFPLGDIVVLVRDPRGYLASRSDYQEKRNKARSRIKSIKQKILLLLATGYNYQKLCKMYGGSFNNSIWIKYEDLVSNPNEVMINLCSSLDIDFEDITVQPTKLGCSVAVPTATQTDKNKIYRDSSERWQSKLSYISLLIVEALSEKGMSCFGYRPVTSVWARRLTRSILFVPAFFVGRLRRRNSSYVP